MRISDLPLARKKRAPKGGWPSHRSEWAILGENDGVREKHFTIDIEGGWTVEGGPGQGPNGERRLFARIEGKRGASVGLFQEMVWDDTRQIWLGR